MTSCPVFVFCFFFNDTATTEIYTLSLHDALPILSQTRLQSAYDLRRPNPLGLLVAVLPQQSTHASQQNLRETASSFDSEVFARVLRRSGLVRQAPTHLLASLR